MSRFTSLLVLFLARQVDSQCTQCALGTFFTIEPTTAGLFVNATKTCTNLTSDFAALAEGTLDESQECKDLQLYGYQLNCCSLPPLEYCTICPDGSDYERLNEIPLGDANPPNCAEYELRVSTLNAFYEAGTCDDTYLRRSAHYCGCPGEVQECNLCPDGADPGAPRKVDAFRTNSNCLGNQYLASLLKEDECNPNIGVDLAAFCECPGVVASEDNECTLCGSGQKIDDRAFVFMEKGVNGATQTRTCAQASDFAAFITDENSCDSLLMEAREACCVKGRGGSGAASLGVVASLTFAGVMATKGLFL